MKKASQRIIPLPANVVDLPGHFLLAENASIAAAAEFKEYAEMLASELRRVTGYPLPVRETGGDAPITLMREEGHGHEAYTINVSREKVNLSAGTTTGIFYATRTLLQLFPPAVFDQFARAGVDWVIPCCQIEDEPRFRWRGMLLDSSRHFQSVAEIKRWIDLMAMHKLNVFHWHLTDHQGWRIEIKKYPKLTEVGAWRAGSPKGHASATKEHDGIPYGGFYTQDEIKDIVDYAAKVGINIMPEIDMPGHCQAALAAYPELGACAEADSVSTGWGGHRSIYNVEDHTFEFLEDVLDEVIALFPFAYLHIGGDEAPTEAWLDSPAAIAIMEREGFKNTHELQTWFVGRIAAFLKTRGRKMVGWDEIADGGLCDNATIMCWRGQGPGIRAIWKGHEAIMGPFHTCYYGYYQTPEISEEPLSNRDTNVPYISLEQAYTYEPYLQPLKQNELDLVLGVQGTLWTEYIKDFNQLEYMAFPRTCAMAEIGWTPKHLKNYDEFLPRVRFHLKRFDCAGIRYRYPER